MKISILGSTGSIGTQTLEVVDSLGDIEVCGISGNENILLLEQQAIKYQPQYVAVMNEQKAETLRNRLKGQDIKVLSGMEGLVAVATMDSVDTVVTSVVGNIGLKPTFEAISARKNIALANKETLVSAGKLFVDFVKEKGVSVYPVDSEHSAIFQSLQGNQHNRIEKILLTASGGAFREKTQDELERVTVSQALKHPNWNMGKKITIDSATLMNKGLEVIEAKWLFDVDVNQIEVLIHPQSIMHSGIAYEDGAVMAQLGTPDMKVPIQYALTYPNRPKNTFKRLDLTKIGALTFEKPDKERFPCLGLAYEALEIGGEMCAVLNGANDIAVARFLKGEIGFCDIARLIQKTMTAYQEAVLHMNFAYTLEDLLEADAFARKFVAEYKKE